MEKTLQVGKTYAVTTSAVCDVVDADGKLLVTAENGQQAVFVATTPTATFSDESASVVAVFKGAPAALGLLGGGNSGGGGGGSEIPNDYISAYFLESNGTQSIDCIVQTSDLTGVRAVVSFKNVPGENSLIGVFYNGERFYAAYWSSDNGLLSGWGPWTAFSFTPDDDEKFEFALNFKNSRHHLAKSATKNEIIDLTYTLKQFPYNARLFSNNNGQVTNFATGRIYFAQFSIKNNIVSDYVPALDTDGEPCMFDKKRQFPNFNTGTGNFIVGFTSAQATKLANLPSTGGSLTISLPAEIVDGEGNVTDSAVQSALDTAAANGWTITIQTYTES